MIRKILLFLATIYVVLWLAGAHLVKSGLISSINNLQNDNFELTYKYISISGFPFKWKIRVNNPKMILIDQISSKEISSDYFDVTVSYNLKKLDINLGKLWNYQDSFSEQQKFLFLSNHDLNLNLQFQQMLNLTKPSNMFAGHMKSLIIDNTSISGLFDGGEFLKINFSETKAIKTTEENNIDNWQITTKVDYDGKDEALITGNANLQLLMNYKINNNVQMEEDENEVTDFDRLIEIENFTFSLLSSNSELNGSLKLSQKNPPKGQFSVTMTEYGQLIDQLIPDGFIVSKSQLKKMITKAAGIDYRNQEAIDKKASFKILFSSDGVSLGS